jgi:hypothetical protein
MMPLLDFHREALRRASRKRLNLHTRRLDQIALEYGYDNPKLDAAEEQRATEYRRRATVSDTEDNP